ncbi:INO80 complex subunit C-like isoform X2 [Acanthaster planci]|uniref:INO80 complex subunit C-like isoform X2 n=1 Tax=Acanthaster planci TaxID=133434 RepID=A0A8B7ZBX5_ACAPL|nr:INO80 complex subunit C-like isoform X2 [Acanthaster planci]
MSAPSPKPTRPRSARIRRATSPASAPVAPKRKKSPLTETKTETEAAEPAAAPVETPAAASALEVLPQQATATTPQTADAALVSQRPALPFKDPNFTHSSRGVAASKKSRVWKTLKQITSAERALPWKPDDATYSSIDAPPSIKPAKKYSDLSGFPAKYTDPQTKLRYADAEEFSRARMLPADIVTGLLTLRKANPELQ